MLTHSAPPSRKTKRPTTSPCDLNAPFLGSILGPMYKLDEFMESEAFFAKVRRMSHQIRAGECIDPLMAAPSEHKRVPLGCLPQFRNPECAADRTAFFPDEARSDVVCGMCGTVQNAHRAEFRGYVCRNTNSRNTRAATLNTVSKNMRFPGT